MSIEAIKRFIKVNSPMIMLVGSLVGLAATIIFSSKAAIDTIEIIDEKKKRGHEISKKEIVKVAAPNYIPVVSVAAGTALCMIGCHRTHLKRESELLGLYSVATKALIDYRKEIAGKHGMEYDSKICESVKAKGDDEFDEIQSKPIRIVETFGNRSIVDTIENLQNAEYELNRFFILSGAATLNDFYRLLGMKKTDTGDLFGWSDYADPFYGYRWIDFQHRFVRDELGNIESVEVGFVFPPHDDYMNME